MGIIQELRTAVAESCIGCEVRREDREHVDMTEFDQYAFVRSAVVDTCDLALNGLGLRLSERKQACRERMSDPQAHAKSVGLRLARLDAQQLVD